MPGLFEPRLLVPEATGIPAHMRVSHNEQVYSEFDDPAITTVVYLPKWSDDVRSAFARLSARNAGSEQRSKEWRPVEYTLDKAQPARAKLMIYNHLWLKNGLPHKDAKLERYILNEITDCQMRFVEAAARHCKKPGLPHYHISAEVNAYGAEQRTNYVFQPMFAQDVKAHADGRNVAIFTNPISTLVVDQTELELPKNGERIPLSQLEWRLWQPPSASFMFVRGFQAGTPQYHLIPNLPAFTQRYRLFVTEPVPKI